MTENAINVRLAHAFVALWDGWVDGDKHEAELVRLCKLSQTATKSPLFASLRGLVLDTNENPNDLTIDESLAPMRMFLVIPTTFTATGGWGELICDGLTGNVIEYQRGGDWKKTGDGYDKITRLDADEWRNYYLGEDISAGHDILDFGSWDAEGTYVGPEMDWREEFAKARHAR
jgi:hypothetical protein